MTNEVEAFEAATRRSRRIKIGLLAALIASPFAYLGVHIYKKKAAIARHEAEWRERERLSSEEQRALTQLIKEQRAAAGTRKIAYAEDVTHERLATARPSAVSCSRRMRPPTASAAKSYVEYGSFDTNYFGGMTYTLIGPSDPIPAPTTATWLLDEVEKALAAGEATRTQYERVSAMRSEGDELLLVVAQVEKPIMTGDSYIPGRIQGRAYLYSAQARRVVCVADLDVQSSAGIDIHYTAMRGNALDEDMKRHAAGTATLERDLDVQLRYAIAAHLRAAE